MNRNSVKILILIFSFAFSSLSFALDTAFYTQSQASLQSMTPTIALLLLKEGNERFTSGKMKNRNLLKQAILTKKAQYPFAFILSCMDSRGSPELIFDQGIGDIFSARVAGNVVNEDQLGSMEYATQVMGAHLIVIMGHTSCGAIKGACEKVKLGNLTQLLDKISPAVNRVQRHQDHALDCNNAETINEIAKQNILNMIQEIKQRSPLIQKSIADKNVIIIGAMQDLKTGHVTFFNPEK